MFDNLLKGSWRTKALGIVLVIQAVVLQASNVLDNDPETKFDYKAVTSAVVAGWALLHTRDNKVTSEEAGAK